MSLLLQHEDINSSRRMQGRRSLAVYETCKVELKSELQRLFQTFYEALNKAQEALSIFPPHSRSRTLESSIIQSCFAEQLLRNFDNNAFLGRHKRLILNVKGYVILFKKLDRKGYPMNIKTLNVQSILNQNQVLDLFSNTSYNDCPILYFGYQKNKIGEYINPQLIYIDEGNIKFSIVEADIQLELPLSTADDNNQTTTEVSPTLKNSNDLKKAN